jgi:hypothetical protein
MSLISMYRVHAHPGDALDREMVYELLQRKGAPGGLFLFLCRSAPCARMRFASAHEEHLAQSALLQPCRVPVELVADVGGVTGASRS